jgi:hypothetical protein
MRRLRLKPEHQGANEAFVNRCGNHGQHAEKQELGSLETENRRERPMPVWLDCQNAWNAYAETKGAEAVTINKTHQNLRKLKIV